VPWRRVVVDRRRLQDDEVVEAELDNCSVVPGAVASSSIVARSVVASQNRS
jgi:hypothetical protein